MASNVAHCEFRDGDNNGERSPASTSNILKLKEQLSSSEQRVKDLEAMLQDQTETKERLKDQLFSSEQRVKDLEAMLLDKNESRKILKEQHPSSEQRVKDLEAMLLDKNEEMLKDEINIERTTTFSRTHVKDLEAMLLDKNETKEILKEQLSSSEQRVKDVQAKLLDQNETKKRLKDQLLSSEQRVKDLEVMLQDKNEHLLNLSQFVQSNPFNVHVTECRDVIVGNSNQLLNIHDEESIDDIKSLIEKLTSTVLDSFEKRASLEIALKEHGNIIDEMKEFVKDLCCKQEQHHSEDSTKLDELLQCLNKEVSEETIIIKCIEELRQIIFERQLLLDKFENIPNDVKYAKRGIIRLVNKFGSKRWFEFANIINVDRTSVRIQADDTNRTLTRDKCTKILIEWIKINDNTGRKLVDIINQADKELSKDMVRTFSKEVTRALQYRMIFALLHHLA